MVVILMRTQIVPTIVQNSKGTRLAIKKNPKNAYIFVSMKIPLYLVRITGARLGHGFLAMFVLVLNAQVHPA